MPESCIICGDDNTTSPLFTAPCGNHYVCSDDLESFFRNAIKDESLYPPQCCSEPFLLEVFGEALPFELFWDYQVKERGEYSVQKKFRVYCANPSCATFLRPDIHTLNTETQVTYAICESKDCGTKTCITCRKVLHDGAAEHSCEIADEDQQFKDTVKKEGYQECYACGSIVELIEACNHISCDCGSDFCYVCGKPWAGLHGCPQYGPAEFDEEGYNQDGYHRETGLNREGLTRVRQNLQDIGEADDGEEEEEEEEDVRFPHWVVQEMREVLSTLPPELLTEAIEGEMMRLIELGELIGEEGRLSAGEDQSEDENGEDELDGGEVMAAVDDDLNRLEEELIRDADTNAELTDPAQAQDITPDARPGRSITVDIDDEDLNFDPEIFTFDEMQRHNDDIVDTTAANDLSESQASASGHPVPIPTTGSTFFLSQREHRDSNEEYSAASDPESQQAAQSSAPEMSSPGDSNPETVATGIDGENDNPHAARARGSNLVPVLLHRDGHVYPQIAR
ncbi:hypothetical protein K505DRAFT_278765 [Melanomma pulvis-pyrius CBS 109.77]|uniref:RBR-type E3 ubiquitin transferase n=1 Tax=Melanomma pulvis-pyrius CBS 109.77 TaxID=1314802 RepID=A0A6A6X7F9_9PLEO|nr:hypothetical protein K505DRAFT_278765 [Melanomma pulvis-pyrius CBS 109.77]